MKNTSSRVIDLVTRAYPLTQRDIEAQVSHDLSIYKQKYFQRHGKAAGKPIDVDQFVKELWDFSIVFQMISQEREGIEILGYLKPETRCVVVHEECENQKRISFTIAHEAGHLSLHAPMFAIKDGFITGWVRGAREKINDEQREWQANTYAGMLLAPRDEVESLLRQHRLLVGNVLKPFDLDEYFSEFEKNFGLSRQALEIRLHHLKIPAKNLRSVLSFQKTL